jgi:tRNA threonylcarbamoyl adenosine modification protein (Sua5/YciO/YrdC/YwlC family)
LIEKVVAAIRAGQPVVVPTDTVYGLGADAFSEEAARRLYRLKGRDELQPTALVAADVDVLVDAVPELQGRAGTIARALLPGPYTLILPNPARRFRWLTGNRPTTIGVRVPEVSGDAAELLQRVGAVAATSANRPGEPDPRSVDEIPLELRQACGAVLDVGTLPGTPSTVLDLTGPEPVVLREGAVPADEALAQLGRV